MDSKHQEGVALLIAMLILLVVSMMGVSAMKGGLFGERMAFNAQSEEMTFQAAETAINGVISEARSPTSSLLTELKRTGTEQVHCFTLADGLKAGYCSGTDTLDNRESVQSRSLSQFDLQRPWLGTDAEALVDNQFHTVGKGSFVSTVDLPFSNNNLQEWRKVGPGQSQFSVPKPGDLSVAADDGGDGQGEEP